MISENIDYSEYGVFNGKPMLPIYNRKERRKYIKEHKHNKEAEHCLYCNAKTLRVSDDNGDWCCELCGKKMCHLVKIKFKNDFTTHITN